MTRARFVDCHSHIVPSGDDGAKTAAQGRALCATAAAHGTRLLYATPHVWPDLPLTREREAEIRRNVAAVAHRSPLELRLGFELTPSRDLLEDDPWRYVLGGTRAVLVEVPLFGPAEWLVPLGEHIEAAGLQPVVAHPERGAAVHDEPTLALELAERGWLLQVNATSLLGRHGSVEEELGWQLVEGGYASLVASDGHRETRPPHLDAAFTAVAARIGADAALPLFDGSALEQLELPRAAAL